MGLQTHNAGSSPRRTAATWLLVALVAAPLAGCDLFTDPGETEVVWVAEEFGGTVGTPYVDDEIVVSGVAFSNRVFARDRLSGEPLWDREIDLPAVSGAPQLSPRLTILGFDDLILVASDWIHALDRETGQVVWSLTPTYDLPGRAGAAMAGDRLVGAGSRLYTIDAASGVVLGSIDTGEYPFEPVYESGIVYFMARGPGQPSSSGVPLGEGHATAVDLSTGDVVWQYFIPDHPSQPWVGGGVSRGALTDELFVVAALNGRVYGLDRVTGDLRWVHEGTGPYSAQVQVIAGVAVVGGPDGSIQGLDALTGELLWTDATSLSSVRRMGRGGGLALAVAGRVRGLNADGREVWGFGGAGWGEPIFTHTPVAMDGVLFVTSVESGLFAVAYPF